MNTSSITRRIFSILIPCVLLFFSCASSKTKTGGLPFDIPLWADSESLEEAFPQKDFLARVAFSDTAESARMNADSELSLYFNAELKVHASADEKFTNHKIGENERTDRERNLSKSIQISSDTELVALRHTDAFFDDAHKSYAVCAYINRGEAWQILEPKLRSLSGAIEGCYAESQKSSELFQKILFLNSALGNSQGFYHLYFLSTVIVPREAQKYEPCDALIQRIFAEREGLKSQAGLSIFVSGDESGRVKTKLTEIFSKNGFSVSSANSETSAVTPYSASVFVKKEISESTSGLFISYPQISVLIEKNGEGIASWARQFPKVAGYTKESCERTALNKIESELEGNFIEECLNITGGKK